MAMGSCASRLATADLRTSPFAVTHRIRLGTRPLNLAVTPTGRVYWGEYFSNHARGDIAIFGSLDFGETWDVFYIFPKNTIRHIHGIFYDRRRDSHWILTGDENEECKIMRASCDLRDIDIVIASSQQARAVCVNMAQEGLYCASDAPNEANYIYRLGMNEAVKRLAAINGSSL